MRPKLRISRAMERVFSKTGRKSSPFEGVIPKDQEGFETRKIWVPPARWNSFAASRPRPFTGSMWMWSSVTGIGRGFVTGHQAHEGVVFAPGERRPAPGLPQAGRDLHVEHQPGELAVAVGVRGHEVPVETNPHRLHGGLERDGPFDGLFDEPGRRR